MKVLFENKSIPIPEPIDCNRHCVVMELIDGMLLNHLSTDDISCEKDVEILYEKLMNLLIKMANDLGVIHGDFNEFNIIIKTGSLEPVLIDFPQMISVSHSSAQTYFDRDVNCIVQFFVKRFSYESDFIPCFESIDKQNSDNLMQINTVMDQIDDKDEDIDTDLKDLIINSENIETSSKVDEIDDKIDEKDLTKNIERLELVNSSVSKKSDDEDNYSNDGSIGRAVSSVATTFTPLEIKAKLTRERKLRENRIKTKKASKNLKGDSNAFMRRRKDDLATVRDDLKAYNCEHDLY
jgi:RIO kinase 2